MNKIYYSYGDMELDLKVIKDQYSQRFGDTPDLIVGLSRGGLVPAVHLSHMFDVPMLPLVWSTRDHVMKDKNVLYDLIDRIHHEEKVLIVDDIFDSGKTLLELSREFYDYDASLTPVYATLMSNNTTNIFSSFIMHQDLITGSYIAKTDNDWVVFPWENTA